MRDDRNPARRQHLVTAGMIQMIVTVDCVLDWEFGQRLNREAGLARGKLRLAQFEEQRKFDRGTMVWFEVRGVCDRAMGAAPVHRSDAVL